MVARVWDRMVLAPDGPRQSDCDWPADWSVL
jgi:hypothetical protein